MRLHRLDANETCSKLDSGNVRKDIPELTPGGPTLLRLINEKDLRESLTYATALPLVAALEMLFRQNFGIFSTFQRPIQIYTHIFDGAVWIMC
jgi:hypothetical protein